MRKIWNIVFVAFAAAAFTVACTKASEFDVTKEEVPQGEQKLQKVTITASIPEEGITKVSFTADVDGSSNPIVKLAWEDTDVITVNGENFVIVAESISGDGKSASFTGDDPGVGPYIIVYDGISGPTGTQIQASDNDTNHLGYSATLSGVDAYKDVQFSSDWATTHGGTFAQSGVLHVQAKLPTAAIADAVQRVIIRTPGHDVLNGSNQLEVIISDPGVDGDGKVLNVYAVLTDASTLADDTELFIDFQVGENAYQKYTAYRKVTEAKALEMGKLNEFKLNCSHINQYAGTSDAGTEANPYLIADQNQMNAMHQLMTRGNTTYFKMVDDVDMTGIVWFPLNNGYDSPGAEKLTGDVYNKFVNFDGNSKTIRYLATKSSEISQSEEYAGFFGALVGEVHHLTIDHATIYPKSKSGILAGWLGVNATYAPACKVYNITISNSSATNGGSYLGGLAGQAGKAGSIIHDITITDCTISTQGLAGGLVALFSKAATVYDITVQGTDVSSTASANATTPRPDDGIAGGIAAVVEAAVDFDRCSYKKNTITNKTATVKGPKNTNESPSTNSRYIGGLVGYVGNNATKFDDCHVNTVTLALNEAGSNNNGRYMGGAFGYIGSSVVVGENNDCTVNAISAANTCRNYVAGFIGYNDGGTIKNSSAAGSITSKGGLGGFVAVSNGGSFIDCTSEVEVSGVGNLGGFVGLTETTAPTFTRCEASGSVQASGDYSGGFVGNSSVGSYNNCKASGTIQSTKAYVGGFVGCIKAGTVTKCSATGGASSTGNFVGGFAGAAGDPTTGIQEGSVTINTSMSDSDVSGNSTVGGLVAYAIDGTLEIGNSYSTCNLKTNARRRGGLIAWVENGNVTVSNCYASGTIDGSFEMGGLVGLVSVSSLNMSKSAAWNTRITATTRAASNWSSAAVVGVTYLTCTLTDNYRSPNMDLTAYWGTNADCSINLLNTFQHPNVSTSAPLTDPYGNAVTSSTMRPYQGKCDASKTLSQLASTTLGWDGNVWDFTGDLPTLK